MVENVTIVSQVKVRRQTVLQSDNQLTHMV